MRSWERSVPQFEEIDIVNLHKEVKRMVLDLDRLETRWEKLLVEAYKTEDILKNMNSVKCEVESPFIKHYRCGVINNVVWLWYCKIKLIIFPILCILLAVFAVAVVLAEISVFSKWFEILNVFRLVNLL